jgi:hypothetical protein
MNGLPRYTTKLHPKTTKLTYDLKHTTVHDVINVCNLPDTVSDLSDTYFNKNISAIRCHGLQLPIIQHRVNKFKRDQTTRNTTMRL